jgi:chromosome segregation ATPase
MMLFIVAVSAARVTVDVSPVEKVITLLGDLRTQVQTEGAAEAATYDEFACFCRDTTDEKVTSINTKDDEVEQHVADVTQLSATRDELSAQIAELNSDYDSLSADLAKATKLREAEHAEYAVNYADMAKAVDSLDRAVTELSGSQASLVEVKSMVHKTMLLADALDMVSHKTKAVSSLLSVDEEPEGAYSFHSGDIIGTLQELHTKFSQKKDSLQQDEDASRDAFATASTAKKAQIDTTKDTLTTQEGELSSTESSLASTEEALATTRALLADDKTYLKDLTEQCETKAKQWDQRSTLREGELRALSQAMEIIEGTVKSNADATGAGGRSDSEGAGAFIQAEPLEEYHDVVFVQAKQVRKVAQAAMTPREKAIALLKQKAKQLHSQPLTMVAMQAAADPFAKVKDLIQKLITRLLTEAKNEATHKGWCDKELGVARKSRDFRHQDVVGLTADIGELEARQTSLVQEKTRLTSEIAELTSALTNATNVRAQEKTDNDATVTNAKEGLTALKEAIRVLSEFYKGAGKATVLMQKASPVGEDLAEAGVSAGFDGAYQGNQAQGNGILGMLATIETDFERTISETSAAEDQSYRDFVAFSKETKASKAAKETGLTNTVNDLAITRGDLATKLNDIQETQGLLDTALRTLADLRPACIDTTMSFEERVQRRENEIDALKTAVCVLDEEDQKLSECSGGSWTAFLQKK